MDGNEYGISNPNWRELPDDATVMLECGMVVREKEVYLAVEKLTPYLKKTEDRWPNETDVEMFILMMRGP